MKKPSLPDQPDSDHARLSPTQADGDLFRLSRTSSRRPIADSLPDQDRAGRCTSLSESQFDKDKEDKEDKKNERKAQLHGETKNHGSSNDSAGSNGGSTKPSLGCSTDNTTVNASAAGSHMGSPANTASATPAPATPLQDAWPRAVLGLGGGKEKTRRNPQKQSEKTSSVSFSASTIHPSSTNGTHGTGSNAEIAVDIPGAETAADPSTGPSKTLAEKAKDLVVHTVYTTKMILLNSWINVLLVFVPAGIVVAAIPDVQPGIVFSLNAIAIVPLAGLLSFATETVAHRMGDSIGALLNVTFGNAVELIIFIALVQDEIRIVQASLLGSILANLLLILGMGFLLGGLRFREQIYNSTVTQMSACLLSLSVCSLVLPTAFHASFKDNARADRESLKISRGTSVILLMVYGIYLLFQLKSHAYMYVSTPQHIIDLESSPGPVANWLDSSSSDDESSSSSDSGSSGHSRDTMKKRMRRVIRRSHRRKSSVASLDTVESCTMRTASFSTTVVATDDSTLDDTVTRPPLHLRGGMNDGNDEAVDEDDYVSRHHKRRRGKRSLRRYLRHRKREQDGSVDGVILENTESVFFSSPPTGSPNLNVGGTMPGFDGETRRVDFAVSEAAEAASARRAFNLRAMSSLRPVAKSLAPTVFLQPAGRPDPAVTAGPIPRVRYGIRRTNSLPDRLTQQYQLRAPGAMMPAQVPLGARTDDLAGLKPLGSGDSNATDEFTLSRRAAILLLLVSTGLVAACAEFMVSSINGLVETSSVGEVFIGLIILPIVGNAAEHVTAVTVAMKNKMDLAIGVAVGSSIQIALFITPLVVILGWCMDRDMTLYFTLFETVCLFVSAFIVNFLVLDGRSNYLEGALLCSTYVIIALVAFFYPKPEDASSWG